MKLITKRFLLATLVLIMIFVFVGCGQTDPQTSNNTVTSSNEKSLSSTSSEVNTTKNSDSSENTGSSERSGTKFPDFEMTDLNGNKITQSIFAERDLTMINIWATSCPPCINEMPDLGELSTILEKDHNSQLIGIVVDVQNQDTLNLAVEILRQSKAEHLNLLPDEGVYKFMADYNYVPTTLFVDSEGYILSKPIVGGHSLADYLVIAKNLLNE